MRMHCLALPSCGATVSRDGMVARVATLKAHADKISKPLSVSWDRTTINKGEVDQDRFRCVLHIVGTESTVDNPVDILIEDMDRDDLRAILEAAGTDGQPVERISTESTIQQDDTPPVAMGYGRAKAKVA